MNRCFDCLQATQFSPVSINFQITIDGESGGGVSRTVHARNTVQLFSVSGVFGENRKTRTVRAAFAQMTFLLVGHFRRRQRVSVPGSLARIELRAGFRLCMFSRIRMMRLHLLCSSVQVVDPLNDDYFLKRGQGDTRASQQ